MTDPNRATAEHLCSLGEDLPPHLAACYPDLAAKCKRNRDLIAKWKAAGCFDLPVDDPSAFYSGEYWTREAFRPYPCVQPGGRVQVGEYHPPAPEWEGFQPILEGMWQALDEKPSTLLDVGCGCGSLVGHARRQGIDAFGVDVSAHAIEHAVENAKGHTRCADIRNPGEVREAEVVTATDLMEHIHEPDLDGVIDALLRLARKHLVMDICVPRTPAHEWVHEPGTPVPLEWAWVAVAGHVTLRPNAFWCGRFEARAGDKFRVNWKAMHRFGQIWALHPALSKVEAWCPANILILSRS
jgi:SAM-dependent methyltransferase